MARGRAGQVAVARSSLQNKRLRIALARNQFSPELGEGSLSSLPVSLSLVGARREALAPGKGRPGALGRARRPGPVRGAGDVCRASARAPAASGRAGLPSGRADFGAGVGG